MKHNEEVFSKDDETLSKKLYLYLLDLHDYLCQKIPTLDKKCNINGGLMLPPPQVIASLENPEKKQKEDAEAAEEKKRI